MRRLILSLLLIPVGCFGGGSPTVVPVPAPAPQQADASVTQAADDERRRRRAAASNTILTSPLGVTGANSQKTQGKTLLGM